jgi:hypothetical protein
MCELLELQYFEVGSLYSMTSSLSQLFSADSMQGVFLSKVLYFDDFSDIGVIVDV